MPTLLVPLDSSQCALHVLPYAQMLAQALQARVQFLQVWELDERIFWARYQHMHEYLKAETEPLRAAGIQVDIALQSGDPAERIVEAAQRLPATLIAMSTHGYSGLQRWTLGSVTDKVVQAATTPVFVVRSQPGPPPATVSPVQRMLVPLDGSLLSLHGLRWGMQLARVFGAQTTLLRVVMPPRVLLAASSTGSAVAAPQDDDLAQLVQQATDDMAELIAQAEHDGPPLQAHVAVGYPAEQIVEIAAMQQSDIIVMATHGYGGLKRWALGSTADKVLRATPTPLLLVRATDDATDDRAQPA